MSVKDDASTLRPMIVSYLATKHRSIGLPDFLKMKTGWTWRRLDVAMVALDLLNHRGRLKEGWVSSFPVPL